MCQRQDQDQQDGFRFSHAWTRDERAQQRQPDLFPPTGASDGTPPLRLALLLPGTPEARCARDVAPLHHRQPRPLVARRGRERKREGGGALESCGRQHPWYRRAKVGCINTC